MMNDLTCDFPGNLQRASVPATGNIDAITFLLGFEREIFVADEQPVPQGCPVLVEGWAVNPDSSSAAAEVVVTIRRVLAVNATTGLRRPDVAQFFDRTDLESTGFRARVPTHELPQGRYDVNFHVVDGMQGSYYTWSQSAAFEIGPPAEGVPRPAPGRMTFSIDPLRVESAGNVAPPDRTVPEHSVVLVEGWVVDAKLEALAGDVYVMLDQRTFNRGLYGYDRDDALRAFDTPAVLASGFKVRFRTRFLDPGSHTFSIIAVSADGSVCDESAEQRFEIVALPDGAFDGALTAQTTTARIERAYSSGPGGIVHHPDPIRVEQGQNVHFSGWAIDEANRAAGLDAALLVDESIFYAAFFGAPRSDVAELLGSADFLNCGFVGAVSTADLAPGVHAVRCLVQSKDGGSWLMGSELAQFEITAASSEADPHRTASHPR